jgi:D-arabinose 1-dehydrogenase-like Zn-dependent alcohol dehydrogenase
MSGQATPQVVPITALAWTHACVGGVTSNTRGNATDFLTLAQRLAIKVTTTPYPFDQADQALADLAGGRVRGAAVLSL